MKKYIFFLQLSFCICLFLEVKAQNYQWAPIGPAPQNNSEYGPISGRIWGAAVSLPYVKNGLTNPGMMFIAVDQGGVWRSKNYTDAQPVWEPLFDKLPRLFYAETIVIDPFHPNRVLIPAGQRMILVSDDSGNSWDTLAKNVFGDAGPCSRLIIDPTDNTGKTMYGVNGGYFGGTGIYKTIDGGQTWNKLSFPVDHRIHALEYVVTNSNSLILYAGLAASGLWQSTDKGITWSKMSITLTSIATSSTVDSIKIGRISLTADHTAGSPNGVYALITDSSNNQLLNMFKLNNSSWLPIGNDLEDADGFNTTHGLNSSSTFQACGISEDGRFYATAGDPQYSPIYQKKSTDSKWYAVENGTNGFRPHTDIHCIVFSNGKVYVTTDGGIYRFNQKEKGGMGRSTWESLNTASLQTILVNGIGVHPVNPDIVLAGSQDNGIALKKASVWNTVRGGDHSKVLFDPSGPSGTEQKAYTTGVDDYVFFFRSKDGGETWEDNSPIDIKASEANVGWYAPFSIHPVDHSRIVIGIDRIYETYDNGDHWSKAKSPIFRPTDRRPSGRPYGNPASAIAFGADNTIWVAYWGNLFRTTNDGGDGAASNWPMMNNGVNFGGGIIKIIIDPQHPSDVFLLVSNNSVWKFQTYFNRIGGAPSFGWQNITSNLPNGLTLKTLCLVPASTGSKRGLFLGTEAGVFLSTDNGNSWRPFNNGLPPGWTEDIQYQPAQKILFAGLYGRGVYRTSVVDVLDRSKQTTIDIIEKKGDCDLGAIEGFTTQFGFVVSNQYNNPIVSIKWTVDNGITQSNETFTGREIEITTPNQATSIGVGVEVEFSDGLKIGKYAQFKSHTQSEAATYNFICNLLNKDRKKPVPWWLWNPKIWGIDPKTNEIIRKPATKEELIILKKEVETFLIQLRKEIELFK